MVAIRTSHLTKVFDTVHAVEDLNLEVNEGEIFGLVGPDGAGKTTTMRLLTAVMDPTSGDAWVLGNHISSGAEAIKENTGYMSQRFGLYPDLTVHENIQFYADIYGVPRRGREAKIDELLTFSGLIPFKQRFARNLSGGMKQKLGLACALIHTPKVLFLDEPTNGVDPVSRRDFWRILDRLLKDGVTIFVSTSYLDEADRCHRVALVHGGKLLACDTPDELRKLLHARILEVHSTKARQAFPLLRRQFASNAVGLFGDRLHVTTDDVEGASKAIADLFRQARLPEPRFRQIEPTLEDVFVSVLAR